MTPSFVKSCGHLIFLSTLTVNKVSRGDGIPAELFQILKDDAVNVLHSICLQIWKTQQWPQDWKRPVFISIPKKGNAKECSDYTQLHSSHMLAWRRQWHPTPVLLAGKFHGWRNLLAVNGVAKSRTRLK